MNWRVLIPVMSVAVLLTSGCASLRFMNSKNKVPEACLATCGRLKIEPTSFILTVNISRQTVSLFEDNKFVKKFRCSTSRFGIGQIEGSNRTPLGLHRIAEKIGGGEPAGTVFKAREIIGHTSQPEFADAKITTRILWLEGLEPGFNQGGNVDSHARYIYIHGTGDQATIGRPASFGCIHLADADMISLFDLLPSGTLVWIAER
jgi:L,D-transpeptidase catalytic domain